MLPMRMRLTERSACASIDSIQVRTLLKAARSMTSKTSRMPCAPRKYDCVIVRKRSWPAVSQICSFTFLPPMSIVCIAAAAAAAAAARARREDTGRRG